MLKWFRRRPEEPSAFDPQDKYYGLSELQFRQLSTYNGERARGIVHTAKWDAEMAALQRRYSTGMFLETHFDDTPTD